MNSILPKKFYDRPALEVARDLLGCFLVQKKGKKEIRAMITDVEAYIGEDDLACHASRGRTPRSEILYGEPGRAYVYLIYGMYHIFNVVVEKKDSPAGIMVRAVSLEGVDYKRTNGPGKVCKVMHIDRLLNGEDVTKNDKIWLEKGKKVKKEDIIVDTRVGIDYAKHCADYPWRFRLK